MKAKINTLTLDEMAALDPQIIDTFMTAWRKHRDEAYGKALRDLQAFVAGMQPSQTAIDADASTPPLPKQIEAINRVLSFEYFEEPCVLTAEERRALKAALGALSRLAQIRPDFDLASFPGGPLYIPSRPR